MSDYTNYLAEHIDKNIAYVEYIAESIKSGTSGVSGVSGAHGYSGSSANKGLIVEKELPKMLEDFRIIEKDNITSKNEYLNEYFPSFHMLNE